MSNFLTEQSCPGCGNRTWQCTCKAGVLLPPGSRVISPADVEKMREALMRYVPDGFRDDDGV